MVSWNALVCELESFFFIELILWLSTSSFIICSRTHLCHLHVDWKRHKKECKKEATNKRMDFDAQNKDKSSLQYGQSQQLLLIIRYLHHFATTSKEMALTGTADAATVRSIVLPKFRGLELGQLQLGMQDVALVWNALWSMKSDDRTAMVQRFLDKVNTIGFPQERKGGPQFSIVSSWTTHAIDGIFAVVKHTPKGSVLVHRGGSGEVKAYLVMGITQSIKSLLEPMKVSLPIYVRTGIFPYKGSIICQGTIMPIFEDLVPPKFCSIAVAFAKGKSDIEIISSLS